MKRLFHLRLRDITPRGLYPRSVLMVILPVILLLTAVTYIFYDSHWRHTSRKLSQTMASEISFMVGLRDRYPDQFDMLREDARQEMQLDVTVLEGVSLPTEQKQLFFTALDEILSRELDVALEEPFWFDISGYGETVEILVQDGNDVIRFIAERDRTFSTTGHIFIVWVIGASGILIALALGFLRNQVRSILRLTEAAKAYGRRWRRRPPLRRDRNPRCGPRGHKYAHAPDRLRRGAHHDARRHQPRPANAAHPAEAPARHDG